LGANAEYVRRWTEALNRRDMDALVEGADPEFEWVVAREHPDATTHRGIDASVEYLREWLRMMPDFHAEIMEVEEHGDRVLTVIRLTGSGAGSGAATEVQTAMLSTFRDGTPVRTEEYLDPDEARRVLQAG
jgi:ketosteroid isomerase-like protein